MSFKGQHRVGTVEGTGSALNVLLGFTPAIIRLWNIDDAGATDARMEWITGMAAASAFKDMSIVDSGTTADRSHELVTSNGITLLAGVAGVSEAGFTIGADSDMNVSGETILWEAIGPDE